MRKIEQWERAISPRETGEVGRVYFVNIMAVFPNGIEWTRHTPITLNPDQGSTVEEMLKRSTQIPHTMKAQLLSQRYAENKLTGGLVYKVWISESPAPDNWGHEKQDSPVLFDAVGQPLRH